MLELFHTVALTNKAMEPLARPATQVRDIKLRRFHDALLKPLLRHLRKSHRRSVRHFESSCLDILGQSRSGNGALAVLKTMLSFTSKRLRDDDDPMDLDEGGRKVRRLSSYPLVAHRRPC